MENISGKILLVDDNRYDVLLIKAALKDFDAEEKIVVAQDGEEAFALLFQDKNNKIPHEHLPRIILLDIKMPMIDGIEVLRVIRSNNALKKIPVIMLSSSRDTIDMEQSYNLGANSFVVKPVNLNEFNSVVKEVGKYWLQINEFNN